MRRISSVAVLLCWTFLSPEPSAAQDWTTLGNDAQRSSWLRSDSKISVESVGSPGFQLVWKVEIDNEPRRDSGLTAPVLLDFLISHRGFRSLAFVGGSQGNVFAIDTDLARLEWERRLGEALEYADPTPDCPGGMTASLTRPTSAALPALAGLTGFGSGRRAPGVSGVGEPGEGAVTLGEPRRAGFRRPDPPKPGARQQPPPRRSLSGLTVVYALTADGLLWTLLASNGHDQQGPIEFLPPNANARGLIVVDDVAYVTTSNGCGGVEDGVWALDLESKRGSSWMAGSGVVVGTAGPVIAPGGTVYAATSDGRVVALDPETLEQSASHQAAGASFVSSPVLIDFHDQDYLAVAAKDGSIHLLDGENLSGAALDKTAADPSAVSTAGALSTWRDPEGVTWLLSPTRKAVDAWRIAEKNGKLSFERGWSAGPIEAPLTPIVVNGVVFAASGSGPAVVHALDGKTGRAIWDSGSAIAAPAPTGGLSAGGGRVYIGTLDGALYAFGFPIEH